MKRTLKLRWHSLQHVTFEWHWPVGILVCTLVCNSPSFVKFCLSPRQKAIQHGWFWLGVRVSWVWSLPWSSTSLQAHKYRFLSSKRSSFLSKWTHLSKWHRTSGFLVQFVERTCPNLSMWFIFLQQPFRNQMNHLETSLQVSSNIWFSRPLLCDT